MEKISIARFRCVSRWMRHFLTKDGLNGRGQSTRTRSEIENQLDETKVQFPWNWGQNLNFILCDSMSQMSTLSFWRSVEKCKNSKTSTPLLQEDKEETETEGGSEREATLKCCQFVFL